jgi:hypothetical protein
MDRHQFQGLFGRRQILWQARWGFYALGISELCPIGAMLCIDDSPSYSIIASRNGTRFLSLESRTRWRSVDRQSTIEEVAPSVGNDIVELLHGSPENWTAVAATPSPALVQLCARMGITCISSPPQLCDWLNNKVNFLSALAEVGLPQLNGRWVRLSDTSYAELETEIGTSLVAQRPRGCTGSGTFFIGSAEDYARVVGECGDALMRVAADVGDLSLNINAIATEKGTAVGYPSVQLAGVPPLCRRRGQYCGNDYAATAGVEPKIVHDVVEQTARIGQWLASLGYRGQFGLDFVVENGSNQAYAVDLNPRWQGSTWLLGHAQAALGRLPLPAAELAYRVGSLSAAEVLRHSDDFLLPVSASQFVVRSYEPGWSTIGSEFEPRSYSFSDGVGQPWPKQRARNPGDGEFMVVGLPQPSLRMEAGAHMLRVCSRGPVYDPVRTRLVARAENALRQLYASLTLTAAEPPILDNSRRDTSANTSGSSNQCFP